MATHAPLPAFNHYNVYPATSLHPPFANPWISGNPGQNGQVSLVQLMDAYMRLEPTHSTEYNSASFGHLTTHALTPTLIFPPPKPYWADHEWTGWFTPIVLSDAWRDNISLLSSPLVFVLRIDGVTKTCRRCAKIVEVKKSGPAIVAIRLTVRLTREEIEFFGETRSAQDEEAWALRVRAEINPVEYSLDFASEEGVPFHFRTHFPVTELDIPESVSWARCRECEAGNLRLVRSALMLIFLKIHANDEYGSSSLCAPPFAPKSTRSIPS